MMGEAGLREAAEAAFLLMQKRYAGDKEDFVVMAALATALMEQQQKPVAVTREMISAAHAVTMKHNEVILSASMLERIYIAMDQAATPSKTPFDTCPTCEALARSIMCDNVGNDTNWEHTARLLDVALQELIVFVDERWGDNECRPLENAKHALGLVKDQE